MSDELINEFLEQYGDRLPNPDHYPLQVKYLFKLFLYYKNNEANK